MKTIHHSHSYLLYKPPLLAGEPLVLLEVDPAAGGVGLQAQAHVLVVSAPQAAIVLESPELSALASLVRHPAVVLVRLHSQHPAPGQRSLHIVPRPWGLT